MCEWGPRASSINVAPIQDAEIHLRACSYEPDAPHIPEVYSSFTPDFTMAYLVMERIEFTPTSIQDLSQRVAQSLRWLHGLIFPDGATIGSLGGGHACYEPFKNYEATLNLQGFRV
jgi:hypothetical protein